MHGFSFCKTANLGRKGFVALLTEIRHTCSFLGSLTHCSTRPARQSKWGSHFVLGFELEELDALGPTASGADGFALNADDLAELADDHELAGSSTKSMLEALPTLGWLHVD